MRRKPAQLPTPGELRILQQLWHLGEANVEQVIASLPGRAKANYKTVQSVLRTMEDKGFVAHRRSGRMFLFFPKVTKDVVNNLFVSNLLRQNFGGSAREALVHLLQASSTEKSELESLERLIREFRDKQQEPKSL
jgi:predicted transcriptional regulator